MVGSVENPDIDSCASFVSALEIDVVRVRIEDESFQSLSVVDAGWQY